MPPRNQAQIKVPLTIEKVQSLLPGDKPYIAWDTKLTGYGVRVYPSGMKSHLVDYRANGGGRGAPHRRTVIGRTDTMSPREARRRARAILGEAAVGADPYGERMKARAFSVHNAFEGFLASNPNRSKATDEAYRSIFRRILHPLANRPLADISRTDVEAMFNAATKRFGASTANKLITLLGAMCRRANAEYPEIGNPVAAWTLGGGRRNPTRRRKAPPPSEALPAWRLGILTCVSNPVHLAFLMFLLHTGARRGEASLVRWADVDSHPGTITMHNTKSGNPLVLPITKRMATIIKAQAKSQGGSPSQHCIFPSVRDAQKPIRGLQALHRPISEAGGLPYWTHALRNCYISVAMRDLGLPLALVKRLVNHADKQDVTEGYAAEWTMAQLLHSMELVGTRIDELMGGGGGPLGWDAHETTAVNPDLSVRP